MEEKVTKQDTYSKEEIRQQRFDDMMLKKKIGNQLSQEFWVYSINAHYFQAINLWCMVFGTDKNETHWRKLGYDRDTYKKGS